MGTYVFCIVFICCALLSGFPHQFRRLGVGEAAACGLIAGLTAISCRRQRYEDPWHVCGERRGGGAGAFQKWCRASVVYVHDVHMHGASSRSSSHFSLTRICVLFSLAMVWHLSVVVARF